jgi:CubicO group peptidase (beta-lactamase class C family)
MTANTMREPQAILLTVLLTAWTGLVPVSRPQEVASKIERYLNSQITENAFRGAVLVAHGDETLANQEFPHNSIRGKEGSKRQERFPVGSIAEQFIAAAILQLEEANKVRLDSPICEYLANCPRAWNEIHVLHLLTHSSGLPRLESGQSCVEGPPSPSSPSQTIATLAARPLVFEPGNRFNENWIDYFLLSVLVERISGQSTRAYLEQRLFHPLHLTRTGYLPPASAHQPDPTGSKRQEDCPQGKLPGNSMRFFLGEELYSTTDDLHTWDRALLTEKFLSRNSLDKMFTPYIEGYGFGWKILKEFDRKVAVQNNESDSNSVSIRVYPDDDTCIIVVSQSHEAAASGLSHELGALLFARPYRVSPNRPSLK